MGKTSYIRFLNYLNTLIDSADIEKLDSLEAALLDEVMQRSSNAREVLVGDLLKLSSIGSQATLHGRIKRLISSGYLQLHTDLVDGRKKKLLPTKLALKRYDIFSKIVAKAVKE